MNFKVYYPNRLIGSNGSKSCTKGPKQLQFYDEFGNLMESEGLVVLISGVYGKSRIDCFTTRSYFFYCYGFTNKVAEDI